MTDFEQLRAAVEELVAVLLLQAKELERLVGRIEQSVGHLGGTDQFPVVASELSELHRRVKEMASSPGAGGGAAPLRALLGDLVQAQHLQAKELERLVEHVEQETGHLGYQHQFATVASSLTGLDLRLKELSLSSEEA
jgi:hypothetical protein